MFLKLFLIISLTFGITTRAAAQSELRTIADAAGHVLASGLVTQRPSTRVAEYAERVTPGVHRWSITFISDADTVAVKINAAGKGEILRENGRAGFYTDAFYGVLPLPRDLPDGTAVVDKARSALAVAFRDGQIQEGHILRYNYCLPGDADAPSDTANGCRREGPLHKWRVYFQLISATGETTVKEITFGDAAPAVIADGPSSFFD